MRHSTADLMTKIPVGCRLWAMYAKNDCNMFAITREKRKSQICAFFIDLSGTTHQQTLLLVKKAYL